jgi:hypothetical protein
LPWYAQMAVGVGICAIFALIMWMFFVIDEDKKLLLETLKSKLKLKKR